MMWAMLPRLAKKKPSAQRMTRTTTIVQRIPTTTHSLADSAAAGDRLQPACRPAVLGGAAGGQDEVGPRAHTTTFGAPRDRPRVLAVGYPSVPPRPAARGGGHAAGDRAANEATATRM